MRLKRLLQCKANDNVDYTEDLYEIKEFLVKNDIDCKDFELYEIELFWRMYSYDFSAGFLFVSNNNLNYFLEWISE